MTYTTQIHTDEQMILAKEQLEKQSTELQKLNKTRIEVYKAIQTLSTCNNNSVQHDLMNKKFAGILKTLSQQILIFSTRISTLQAQIREAFE
jgi:hypothetical protein